MKTNNTFKYAFTLSIMLLSFVSVLAQKKELEKGQYRIKIIDNVNGQQRIVDTIFDINKDLNKFKTQIKLMSGKEGNTNMNELLKLLNNDSIMAKLSDTKLDIDWNRIGEFEDIKIVYNDSQLKNTMNVKIEKFELSEDDKAKLLNSKSTDEILKMFNIDIDVDSLEKKGAKKEVKIVTIFKRIEITDAPQSILEQSQHPQMKAAANDEKLTLKNIKAYPNPSAGNLTLEIETEDRNEIDLLVTDIQGKEILKENFTPSSTKITKTINMEGTESGVYLLKVTSKGKSVIKKLIIEN